MAVEPAPSVQLGAGSDGVDDAPPPPPPLPWKRPTVGMKIEVNVRLGDGATEWQSAKVNSLYVTGSLRRKSAFGRRRGPTCSHGSRRGAIGGGTTPGRVSRRQLAPWLRLLLLSMMAFGLSCNRRTFARCSRHGSTARRFLRDILARNHRRSRRLLRLVQKHGVEAPKCGDTLGGTGGRRWCRTAAPTRRR